MRRLCARLLLPVCLLFATPTWAAKVSKLQIEGLQDEAMQANVRSALSLHNELDKPLTARRLAYLLRIAETEAQQALEPFGHYAATVKVQRSDRADTAEGDEETDGEAASAAGKDRTITVTLHITPGEPVRVRDLQLSVSGAAGDDPAITQALTAFAPRRGEVLDHTRYETGKARINRALADNGYFDADYVSHRVEVTRAQHAADIDLRWRSGERFAFGEARFEQTPTTLNASLLQKLVPWQAGDPYDAAALDQLRQSLAGLDYFALFDVQPLPAEAQDQRVPIEVTLTPAKRSIYTAGASYGTVTGTGFSLGVERRYVNTRGHKTLAQIDWAAKRKTATLQYRVPAFSWRDGWYTATLQAGDEQTKYINSRRLEFVASRNGQYNPRLNLSASLHVLRERWAWTSLQRPTQTFQFASFVFPALHADYIDVDDRMQPRRGQGGSLTLRGGKGGSDGNATFTQLHVSLQWFHGLDADSRLIARGELGHTFTRDVLNLPPSLRYYAGGDRSVRGYGWHEIGPRLVTAGGEVFTGAPNVLAASLEYERYFKGPWGAAVFIDSGSAFDGNRPDMHTGVGIGLRWRSPVGPVRIDIARGLNTPDSPFTVHLNIGADL